MYDQWIVLAIDKLKGYCFLFCTVYTFVLEILVFTVNEDTGTMLIVVI